VDDRRRDDDGARRRFHSQILPPYMRRSPKVAEVRCRSSTCAAFPRVISKRAWPPCSVTGRRASRPPRSRALQPRGRRSTRPTRSATCRIATTSTSGPTASTSASAWRRTACARW
jgi:hypothetical protein